MAPGQTGPWGGSGTGAYCWMVSFCPVILAAFMNCAAMSSGDRSLMVGTTIRVLGAPAVVAGIRAPQILAWPIAVLTADSSGYWVTLSENVFAAAVRMGEGPVTPNGMSVALGECPALM